MIEISEELKQEMKNNQGLRKNITVHFPNGEADDITNDNMLAESLEFTESIMSRDEMKFGLCEGNVIEFDVAGIGNVKGATIEVSMGFDGFDETIKLGRFIIDECKKNPNNLQQRHISAYSDNAYTDWEWNPIFAKFMSAYSWRTAENMTFSFDTIKKIQFPEECLKDLPPLYVVQKISEGEDYRRLTGNDYEFFKEGKRHLVTLDAEIKYKRVRANSGIYTVRTTNLVSAEQDKRYLNDILENSKNKLFEYLIRVTGFSDDFRIEALWKEATRMFKQTDDNVVSMNPYYDYKISNGYMRETKSSSVLQGTGEFISGNKIIHSKMENIPVFFKSESASTYNYWSYLLDSNYGHSWLMLMKKVKITVKHEDFDAGTTEEFTLVDFDADIEFMGNAPDGQYNMTFLHTFVQQGEEPALTIVPKKVTKRTVYNNVSAMSGKTTRTDYIYELPENLREIFEGNLELRGDFGRINREGEYEELSLGADWLYPSEELYPADDVYPGGADADIGFELYTKKMYSQCYTDDEPTKPYGMITATFTNTDGEQDTAFVYLVDAENYDSSKYQTYDISDNYVIRTKQYTDEEIKVVLNSLGEKIKNIQYTPMQLTAIGLPYVEAGDRINILTDYGSVDSYVLRRTINGIQSLKDNIEAN